RAAPGTSFPAGSGEPRRRSLQRVPHRRVGDGDGVAGHLDHLKRCAALLELLHGGKALRTPCIQFRATPGRRWPLFLSGSRGTSIRHGEPPASLGGLVQDHESCGTTPAGLSGSGKSSVASLGTPSPARQAGRGHTTTYGSGL